MRNMQVFLCGVSMVRDINAMVSGGMRIDGRIKNKRANVQKKWSRSERHESNK
jgi:hypothetical protein